MVANSKLSLIVHGQLECPVYYWRFTGIIPRDYGLLVLLSSWICHKINNNIYWTLRFDIRQPSMANQLIFAFVRFIINCRGPLEAALNLNEPQANLDLIVWFDRLLWMGSSTAINVDINCAVTMMNWIQLFIYEWRIVCVCVVPVLCVIIIHLPPRDPICHRGNANQAWEIPNNRKSESYQCRLRAELILVCGSWSNPLYGRHSLCHHHFRNVARLHVSMETIRYFTRKFKFRD